MPKRREAPAGSGSRLKILMKTAKTVSEIKRIQCVYFRVKYDYSPEQISDMVGYHPCYVKQVQSHYWKEGEISLPVKQRGGRRRENLSIDEEKTLLAGFTEKASSGGVLEVAKIREAYTNKIKKKVPGSTVYRMLHRHGWRKIAPRPKHPKSDPISMERFKKKFRTDHKSY